MKKELSICGINVKVGEKKQGFIKVLDTLIKMPATIINGKKEGKTILITAGIHGCEYPGIKSAIELAKEIDPQKVSGNIIIVHLVNTEAFEKRTPAVVPEDNKNLLRVFPGDKNGTLSEKMAYVIANELQSKADFYLDMHGGDLHEDLIPHLYYPGAANLETVNKSIEIAKQFNVKYFVQAHTTSGSYTWAAINKNVPSLLIERGGCGLCKEENVLEYKKDILNVLSYLNILDYEKIENTHTPKEITESRYLNTSEEGCWICMVKPGDLVKKGEKLGEITDLFGNVIDSYYAEFDGVVLYNTVAYSVKKGNFIVAYGRV